MDRCGNIDIYAFDVPETKISRGRPDCAGKLHCACRDIGPAGDAPWEHGEGPDDSNGRVYRAPTRGDAIREAPERTGVCIDAGGQGRFAMPDMPCRAPAHIQCAD